MSPRTDDVASERKASASGVRLNRSVGLLGEYSPAGQYPQQSMHRIGVGADLIRDGLGRARSSAQYVSDAELSCGVDGAGKECGRHHVQHRNWRGHQLLLEAAQPAPHRIDRASDPGRRQLGAVGHDAALGELESQARWIESPSMQRFPDQIDESGVLKQAPGEVDRHAERKRPVAPGAALRERFVQHP